MELGCDFKVKVGFTAVPDKVDACFKLIPQVLEVEIERFIEGQEYIYGLQEPVITRLGANIHVIPRQFIISFI